MRSWQLQVLLLVGLVLCSLLLVNVRYQSRKLFIELEFEQAQARQLEIEWSQLQLEQSSLGKHARIESSAKNDLNMVQVGPANTRYITVTTQ